MASVILKIVLLMLMILINSVSFSNEKTSALTLEKKLSEIQNSFNIPAYSFVLVDHENIIKSASSGFSNIKNKNKLTLDTMIRIGSITKSFTALAILKLQQQGKLKLDDQIKQYSDDLPLINQWSDTNPIKIAHLLEHTAGLLDLSKAEFAFNNANITSIKQAFLFKPNNRKTMWPPGQYTSYTNVGAGYLGYAIEKISGISFERYLSKFILKPLAMDNTNFIFDVKTRRNLATGYDIDGKSIIPYWHMIFRPFGAMNTSTRQMAYFVQLFLNDGKIGSLQLISPDNINRMETPQTSLSAKSGLEFGYGLANYSYLHNGFVFHGHGGDADGFLAHYAYNRDSDLGYFIVINSFNRDGLHNMRRLLEDYITSGIKKTVNVKKIKHDNLRQFVGNYKALTYRMPWLGLEQVILKIRMNNNKLFYTLNNETQELIAVNQFHFRFEDQPIATMAFIKKLGEMHFQNSDENFIRY